MGQSYASEFHDWQANIVDFFSACDEYVDRRKGVINVDFRYDERDSSEDSETRLEPGLVWYIGPYDQELRPRPPPSPPPDVKCKWEVNTDGEQGAQVTVKQIAVSCVYVSNYFYPTLAQKDNRGSSTPYYQLVKALFIRDEIAPKPNLIM